jgi:hypothetical protein
VKARKLFEFAGGFPVEEKWLGPPWNQARELSRAELARAKRGLAELPSAQRKGMARLLARLESGQLEPFAAEDGYSREVRRQAAAFPEALGPLLQAIAWATLSDPGDAAAWFRFVGDRQRELTALLADEPERALGIVFQLRALLVEARLAEPLVRDVLDPRMRVHPVYNGVHRPALVTTTLRRLLDSLAPGTLQARTPVPFETLVGWLGSLAGRAPRARRDCLRLYALIDLPAVVSAQAPSWKKLEALEKALAPLGQRTERTEAERERMERLLEESQALQKAWPADAETNLVSFILAIGLAVAREGATERIVKALPRFGLTPAARLVVWIECACRAAALPEDADATELHWPRVEALLAATPSDLPEKLAMRAAELVFGDVTPGPFAPLGGHRWRGLPARRVWDAVIAMSRLGVAQAKAIRVLPAAVEIAGDAALAVEMVKALDAAPDLEPADIRAVLRALPGDLGQAKALVERVKKLHEGKDLEAAVEAFAAQRRTGDARALLLEGHGKALIAAGKLVRFIDAKKARKLIPSHAPPRRMPVWATVYPEALHPALGRLALAAGDEAEAIAGRFLKELVASGGRPARAVSKVRLANLAEKIEAAARRATLERWRADLAVEARRGLAEGLGVPSIPAEWIDAAPRRLECFAQAMKLPAESRRMARRVLSRRLGPPPWDLREEPHNAEYLARLTARGIDVGPWLDGIPAMEADAPAGKVRVAFEPDPLELLEMGAHFGTCLSPGQCNYFSVFANLVDVNKRVIYGRDPHGKVQARCLLGLTAQGGLVTFHAYRHGNWAFDDLVRDFVGELAKRMRTVVLARGDVPRLAAHDWYDDGPVDLTGRLSCFAEGSTLRDAIGQVAATDLRAMLVAELGSSGLRLDELTFPLVVGLDEVRREALAVPLAELALEIPSVPAPTLERILALALGQAAKDEVVRLLGPKMLEAAERANDPVPDDLWSIAGAHPSATLAFLRATHPPGVRTIEEETRAERLGAAAEALYALQRPRQSEALYKKLLAGSSPQPLAGLARQRLADLGVS